jgi:hypothetical protein
LKVQGLLQLPPLSIPAVYQALSILLESKHIGDVVKAIEVQDYPVRAAEFSRLVANLSDDVVLIDVTVIGKGDQVIAVVAHVPSALDYEVVELPLTAAIAENPAGIGNVGVPLVFDPDRAFGVRGWKRTPLGTIKEHRAAGCAAIDGLACGRQFVQRLGGLRWEGGQSDTIKGHQFVSEKIPEICNRSDIREIS